MRIVNSVTRAVALCFTATMLGCVTLAPGADQVKITKNAADVSTCTAVGNIQFSGDDWPGNIQGQLRNQTIGLGGNVALDTSSSFSKDVTAIAYRCLGAAPAR